VDPDTDPVDVTTVQLSWQNEVEPDSEPGRAADCPLE
jgi:hypothetical protein